MKRCGASVGRVVTFVHHHVVCLSEKAYYTMSGLEGVDLVLSNISSYYVQILWETVELL